MTDAKRAFSIARMIQSSRRSRTTAHDNLKYLLFLHSERRDIGNRGKLECCVLIVDTKDNVIIKT